MDGIESIGEGFEVFKRLFVHFRNPPEAMEFDPLEGEAFRRARDMRRTRLEHRFGLRPETTRAVVSSVHEALNTHHMHERYGLPYSGGYEEQPADFLWCLEAVLYAKDLAAAEIAAEREFENADDSGDAEE